MSWPTVMLGEIAKSVDYGLTASANDRPVGPKFLRITDIQDDSVDWDLFRIALLIRDKYREIGLPTEI